MEQTKKVYQNRKDIPEQHRWNLKDIYPTEDLWEQDFKLISEYLDQIGKFQGRVIESANHLYETLKLKDKMLSLFERVTGYAMLYRDTNTADQHYQGLANRVTALSVKVDSKLSFITPEILQLTSGQQATFLDEHDRLNIYQHFLDDLQRQKEHFRSPEQEELIALSGEMAQAPQTIFSLLTNADMEFPEIEANGEKVRLTPGNFIEFLQSEDRRIRQSAHNAIYKTYTAHSNTLGATYSSSVKSDLFQARVRHYDSSLESAMDPDNIPVSLYEGLLDSVGRHLPLLHRYIELKKKVLELDSLSPYDLYVPLTKESQWKPNIEEAQKAVLEGLSVMGDEYTGLLASGFNDRWLDVYETKGKRSGAYSMGVIEVHPYILLNYQPNMESVFTIAHEMGHALHSYYTNKNQPYTYTHYPIFLAEVASTVNEALLFNHLLSRAEGNNRVTLLEKNLEQFRATVFRQVLFAEFEKETHELAESGQPLTPDTLNQIYAHLLSKYYGPHLALDDYIKYEWSRIPHFYSAFYVYKYATGFSSAVAIAERILKEGSTAVERYLGFLKSGSSAYPLETLKEAGVDLLEGHAVDDALKVFQQRLEEFESLIL